LGSQNFSTPGYANGIFDLFYNYSKVIIHFPNSLGEMLPVENDRQYISYKGKIILGQCHIP
jgi:hypothetical protein